MEEDARARAEEMRLLEGSLREAGDRNDVLIQKISRLRSEIDDARARRFDILQDTRLDVG